MKFTEHLSTHLTPEWRIQYIEYEKLKEVLYDALDKMPPKDESPETVVQRYVSSFEDQWFSICEEELEKINTFFAEKIAEADRKFHTLKSELHLTCSMKTTLSLSTMVKSNKAQLAPKSSKKMEGKKQKTIADLKLAFSEFYLSLVLIQNYQRLNFTGFRKILKKHDKLFETCSGLEYRHSKIEMSLFFTNKHVEDIILETENLFISELEHGNRSKAMKRLRVPPLGEELVKGSLVQFRVGFFAGLFVMLVSVAVITGFYTDHSSDEFEIAIRIYRGIFLLVLVTFLLAINTWGWRKSGVNHVLIFELDPRDHLNYQQLLEVAFLLAVLWAISLVVFMFNHVLGINSFLPNLVLVSALFLFLFNPFRLWYFTARFWLLKVLFRIFTSPFQHVGFADFWMADQLNSLVVALLDFQYIICFYSHDWHVENARDRICDTNLYGARPLVACLPAWFRFAQCLRRYKDTRQAFPHLVNAGKYSTSFFVVAFSTLAKSDSVQGDRFFLLWIISAVISTCYTLTWDIKMDWGLLDKNAGENTFLREETVYQRKAFYYFAMVEDLIFRFLWTLTVSVGQLQLFHSEVLKLFLSICEVFRRFVWNFFRLENEHLNNCGNFRAVRDISVVPEDSRNQALLEQMMDSDSAGLGEKRSGTERRRKIPKGMRKTMQTAVLIDENELSSRL